MKEESAKYVSQTGKQFHHTEVKYVVHTAEGLSSKWKVVSKKELLSLNPHDVVTAYELGKEVKLTVSIN